jgi:uncharacterized protein (TIGR00661 family)
MKVLFGVFDWGLGHATRDTPLIEGLLKKGDNVDILSTGRSLSLLKDHFGERCRYFDVASIHPPYAKSGFFVPKFTLYIPKMFANLKNARKFTKKIIMKNKYDRIVSDCRYDVYDKKDNSFLINHQLTFKPKIFQPFTETFLKVAMDNYNTILVPDFKDRSLSGELSVNKLFNGTVEFIGILSRLKKLNVKEDIDYFISISGPEPCRTLLEKAVLSQIKQLNGKIVIAGGTPENKGKKENGSIQFFNYLDLKQQESVMNRAKFIVSRSGYSTILEFAELEKKKALLIPTPGQSEQEYLADFYEQNKMFHHVHQSKLILDKDIRDCNGFNGIRVKGKTDDSVKNFLKRVSP